MKTRNYSPDGRLGGDKIVPGGRKKKTAVWSYAQTRTKKRGGAFLAETSSTGNMGVSKRKMSACKTPSSYSQGSRAGHYCWEPRPFLINGGGRLVSGVCFPGEEFTKSRGKKGEFNSVQGGDHLATPFWKRRRSSGRL